MHSSIEAYLVARKALLAAEAKLTRCEELASLAPLPSLLRPALSKDIVEGAIVWYPRHTPRWQLIEEVHSPLDPFKAFTANDGCRYGLEGAYVEEA